ncbi:MAG: type A2 lantipeptide [Bacteroidetes bacterium]|nr:type A2 lantipeptide [Bacteroidota bacterium]
MKKVKKEDKFEKFIEKVEINEELLTNARGGQGSGWIFTISGECSPTNPPTNCRRLSTWLSPLG